MSLDWRDSWLKTAAAFIAVAVASLLSVILLGPLHPLVAVGAVASLCVLVERLIKLDEQRVQASESQESSDSLGHELHAGTQPAHFLPPEAVESTDLGPEATEMQRPDRVVTVSPHSLGSVYRARRASRSDSTSPRVIRRGQTPTR